MSSLATRSPDTDEDVVEPAAAPERARAVTRRTVLGGVASAAVLAACADMDMDVGDLDEALAGGGSASGAGSGASGDGGAAPAPAPPAPATPAVPITSVLAEDQALHLLRRATYGPTPELVAEISDIGVNAWLAQQLSPDTIDDSECDEALARFRSLDRTARQIKDTDRDQGGSQEADKQLVEATVVRRHCSKRQLLEAMVEFWRDFFNIHTPSDDSWGRSTVADREVFRPNALGSFADLLLQVSKSAAMLRYLNNEDSCFDGDPESVQENYGREVLELFSVGVDGGYDEDDVKQSSYILTGLTTDDDREYTYDADCHYVGPVQVMDFTHPNGSAEGGEAVAEAYLDYLAKHPSTASYVSTRLARRFVSDTPSEALVAAMAQSFLDNGTQIVPVLQTMFGSDEFAGAAGQKIKRPIEDILSAARALGVAPRPRPRKDRARDLTDVAYDLAHAPLNWGPPDGYPDVAPAWLSSARLLGGWNYHWDLLDGRYDDALTEADAALDALVGGDVATVGALVAAIAERLLFQPVDDATQAAIVQYTGRVAADPVGDDRDDLVRRIALAVLNSPYFLQR